MHHQLGTGDLIHHYLKNKISVIISKTSGKCIEKLITLKYLKYS